MNPEPEFRDDADRSQLLGIGEAPKGCPRRRLDPFEVLVILFAAIVGAVCFWLALVVAFAF